MNRKKVILSIFLMMVLTFTGLVLPNLWRNQKKEEPLKEKVKPPEEKKPEAPDKPALEYIDFAALKAFFSDSQISSLKEQFPVYLSETDRTGVAGVTFQPGKTSYPSETSVCLLFELSDGSMLPVTYHTPTGVFLFGEEGMQLTDHSAVYEKQTDDSLPSLTTEEIENLSEGGYPDTPSTPAPDTPPVQTDKDEEVQQ